MTPIKYKVKKQTWEVCVLNKKITLIEKLTKGVLAYPIAYLTLMLGEPVFNKICFLIEFHITYEQGGKLFSMLSILSFQYIPWNTLIFVSRRVLVE